MKLQKKRFVFALMVWMMDLLFGQSGGVAKAHSRVKIRLPTPAPNFWEQ